MLLLGLVGFIPGVFRPVWVILLLAGQFCRPIDVINSLLVEDLPHDCVHRGPRLAVVHDALQVGILRQPLDKGDQHACGDLPAPKLGHPIAPPVVSD